MKQSDVKINVSPNVWQTKDALESAENELGCFLWSFQIQQIGIWNQVKQENSRLNFKRQIVKMERLFPSVVRLLQCWWGASIGNVIRTITLIKLTTFD